MLLPDPDPLVPLACSLSPEAWVVASDLADAVFSAARFSPQLETGGIASAFMIPEENIPITIDLKPSTLDRYLPEDVRNGLSKATIMIAGQPCDREMLPDTVTTDRTEFMNGLRENGHMVTIHQGRLCTSF